jgi:hypothetical protein
LDQARGGGTLLIGDEIERTALIVLAPAPPVADLLQQPGDLLGGVRNRHRTTSGNLLPVMIGEENSARSAMPPRRHGRALSSLGLLLRLQVLDFPALALDFALLLIHLRLCLGLLRFLVLHRVAHRKPADAADRTADSGAGAGRTNRRTDYRASGRTQTAADQGAFFTRAERLTAASHRANQHRQTKQANGETLPRPEHVNLPRSESLLFK